MRLYKLSKKTISSRLPIRCFATALRNEDEYTATPQYPPILDLSFEKRLERKKKAVHEEVTAVKTVEEKQIKLNMPKYYGFKSYMLREDTIPYDSLPLAQHVTRTHLIVNNNLPDFYKNGEIAELSKLKGEIEEALLIEIDGYKRQYDLKEEDLTKTYLENILSSSITRQINRIIINNLSATHPHILDIQVDIEPRLEAAWYAGGMNPPARIKNFRSSKTWLKDMEDEPINRLMVYIGSPSLMVRSELPLKPILSLQEAENPDFKVPVFQYDPRVVSTFTEHRHMANIPGFWPGDPHRFGLISYHNRGHMLNREKFGDASEHKEALHRQGILASFGWLFAQANLLGFTTFTELTYPLATQTVITNGKLWSFYVYQLNTVLFHSHYLKDNHKKNLCWATEEFKLYEDVQHGKIVGLNEDVLKLLLKFYVNAPESRLGINMTPYLSSDEKLVADYEDDEKRIWLEREYKHLMANRPRLKDIDEVYLWEKIYKIDNKTRFMDKRLRPFEKFIKPHDRKLNDRLPEYIPRSHRPDLPRWKGRYKKEFWP